MSKAFAMNPTRLLIAAIITVFASASAFAAPDKTSLSQDLDRLETPITSQAELDQYSFKFGETFLDTLPQSARSDFLASVRFNERGLASFETAPLEDHLTATEAYRFLSFFNLQSDTDKLHGLEVMTALDAAIMAGEQVAVPESELRTMSNLGVSADPPGDGFLMGYICESRGSCGMNDAYACTSNC